MFLPSRITNGVVATLFLFVFALFSLNALGVIGVSYQSADSPMWELIAIAATPPILFGFDLIFRRRDSLSDLVFTGCWMALYMWCVVDMGPPLLKLVTLDVPSIVTPSSHAEFVRDLCAFAVLVCGPLLMNGAYLLQQFAQWRKLRNNFS
jgi:hypothetical protein